MLSAVRLTLGVALLVCILPLNARADPILQPVGVSTNMGVLSSSTPLIAIINQSGLSRRYTSLVTDFDTYLSSVPRHSSAIVPDSWASATGVITGNVDFNLGGTYTVESMALWNLGENSDGTASPFNL